MQRHILHLIYARFQFIVLNFLVFNLKTHKNGFLHKHKFENWNC